MKWRNHKITTFCSVFAITGGFIASAAATIGSCLPDVMEFRGSLQHRTVTHYLWFWLASATVLWVLLRNAAYSSLPLYISFFIVSGGLLHIVQDSLSNGGVPMVTPYGRRFGFGLYRTGTLSEEFTVLGLSALFTLFAWKRGFLSSEYIASQAKVVMGVLKRTNLI